MVRRLLNGVIGSPSDRVGQAIIDYLANHPEIEEFYAESGFEEHDPVRQADAVSIARVKIRLWETVRFLEETTQGRIRNASVLDVGDSDGKFLKQLGCVGVGLNILWDCVSVISGRGVPAVQGDVEGLPFANAAFDYVISFECLEHLPNPVRAIQEMMRVSRRGLFISIPWRTQTRVIRTNSAAEAGYSRAYDHIFEFSERDVERLVRYFGFRIAAKRAIRVASPRRFSLRTLGVRRRGLHHPRWLLLAIDANHEGAFDGSAG